MGEAKIRRAQNEAWYGALTATQQTIADTVQNAHRKIIVPLGATGMCYRISLFLAEFLREEHDISVDVVVGYVNDGETELMASHAWLEHHGMKIDIGLTITENADIQPTGPMIVFDREMTSGTGSYTYHNSKSAAAKAEETQLMEYPQFQEMLNFKNDEHAFFKDIASNSEKIRPYLDAAPDGNGYDVFKSKISL